MYGESFVSRFCVQMVMILVLPRVIHKLVLQHMRQPPVVSEIFAGIIFGPSCLGQVGGFEKYFFPTRSLAYLNAVAIMGVFFYMFTAGCRLDVSKVRSVASESLCATLLISVLNLAAAAAGVADMFLDPKYTSLTYHEMVVLIGMLLAISASLLLARILAEQNLQATRLCVLTLIAATEVVFVCSLLLAAVVTLHEVDLPCVLPLDPCPQVVTTSALSKLDPLWNFVGYCLALATVFRFVFYYLARDVMRKGMMTPPVFSTTCTLVFISCWLSQTLTVSVILGGICLGLLSVPRVGNYCQLLFEALYPLTSGIMLPVFFTLVGLKTDWTLLDSYDIGLALLLFGTLWSTTFMGCLLVSVIAHRKITFEGVYFAILMTCKGLTTLAMLNTLTAVGVVTIRFYSLGVLYSIISIVFVGPLLSGLRQLELRWKRKAMVGADKKLLDEMDNATFMEQERGRSLALLAIPNTPYLAPCVAALSSWVAGASKQDTLFLRFQYEEVRGVAAPIGLEESLSLDLAVICSDVILSQCYFGWRGDSDRAKYCSFAGLPSPEKAVERLLDEDIVCATCFVVGYHNHSDAQRFVRVALARNLRVYVITGQPGVRLAAQCRMLVITEDSSEPGFVKENEDVSLSFWKERGVASDREEVLQLLSTLSDKPPSEFDAVCIMTTASTLEESMVDMLDVAYQCKIPVMVEFKREQDDKSCGLVIYQ